MTGPRPSLEEGRGLVYFALGAEAECSVQPALLANAGWRAAARRGREQRSATDEAVSNAGYFTSRR
jgi:hypothetical protein